MILAALIIAAMLRCEEVTVIWKGDADRYRVECNGRVQFTRRPRARVLVFSGGFTNVVNITAIHVASGGPAYGYIELQHPPLRIIESNHHMPRLR